MKWRAELLLLALAATPLPVTAATTCSGGNVALGFGSYDYFSAGPNDSQATFVVTCTRDGGPATTTVTVGLGPSGNTGSIQNRQLALAGNPDRLDYNVYLDATRLSVWGNTAGTDTMSQTLTIPNKASLTASFTFFGRIFSGQDVRAGFYNDSLLVTVSF